MAAFRSSVCDCQKRWKNACSTYMNLRAGLASSAVMVVSRMYWTTEESMVLLRPT